MSTLTWITEKEIEREIKTEGHKFRWKKNKKFYSGGQRKRRNASCHQGENEQHTTFPP